MGKNKLVLKEGTILNLFGVKIEDNVTAILTDSSTGEVRKFTTHNTPLDYMFQALASAITGEQFLPPSQAQLGSGQGTPSTGDSGLFSAIEGSKVSISYSLPNSPVLGTATLVFQIGSGIVTTEVTEALLMDSMSRPLFHTMFPVPFTPSAVETITFEWTITFSA